MKIKFHDNYSRNIFKTTSKSHGLVICLEAYVLKTQSAIRIFFIVVHIHWQIGRAHV